MPVIYLVGDSTVDDNTPPFRGWGWALPQFVGDGVRVENHALSGCSSRSFMEQGLFEPIEKAISKGDMLLIQFGHNDEKDDERHTDPDSTFPEFLWRYCQTALDAGAQPVLITPVERRLFMGDAGVMYSHGEYPRAIRLLAKEKDVPLCDLNADSRKLYLELGQEKTAELFVRLAPGEHPDFPEGHDDKTHFCAYGAEVMAGLVAEELREIPACAPYLKESTGRLEK